MTGKELRALRSFNRISQTKLGEQCGYYSRDTIRKYEKSDFVPNKFVIALSQLTGYDFTNEKNLEKYLTKIPSSEFDKYKSKRFSSLFRKF